MSQKEAKNILLRYQAGTATTEERALVENWMLHGAADDLDLADEEILQDLLEIKEQLDITRDQKRVMPLWWRVAAAAVVLLAISVGSYFLLHQQPEQRLSQNPIHDIKPGSNKAILVLSNGRRLVLTNARNGKLTEDQSTIINKTADGEVAYHARSTGQNKVLAYNTITTPRGGQFTVRLPDGSHVWLNDASSIRFPVMFAGKERRVEVTGEAYFEVAHDRTKPFRVTTNGQTVEVLGTHFNVNGYPDEPETKTTLLEGSIRINKGKAGALLSPGQQASLQNGLTDPKIIVVPDANTGEAIAWKNGFFQFKRAGLPTIMRQLTRWYDVEVKYKGKIPEGEFTGQIPREVNLSEALEILKFFNVTFRVDGKVITITP